MLPIFEADSDVAFDNAEVEGTDEDCDVGGFSPMANSLRLVGAFGGVLCPKLFSSPPIARNPKNGKPTTKSKKHRYLRCFDKIWRRLFGTKGRENSLRSIISAGSDASKPNKARLFIYFRSRESI